MKTDFDFATRYAFVPTVFSAEFNSSETITANQAWSLFFTAGRNDQALGNNPELGRLFNNILKAVAASAVIGAVIFSSF